MPPPPPLSPLRLSRDYFQLHFWFGVFSCEFLTQIYAWTVLWAENLGKTLICFTQRQANIQSLLSGEQVYFFIFSKSFL